MRATKSSLFEQIHNLVRQIPPGKVATYGQIARWLGLPRAARTVGWALRATPEASGVPWQRVINARGTVSFGSGSPGAFHQRALLEEEGVVFDSNGRVDLDVYGWAGPDLAERDQLLKPAGEP
jgi:methylated-DNA-protein-cysteine methyltransferase-like protein